MSSQFIPMIIVTDNPVRWSEYIAAPPVMAEDNKIILATAAETLGIAPADIPAAASAGRIEWQAPFTAGRTDPIFARLDGGRWVLQPGIRNGTPPMPPALVESIRSAASPQFKPAA